MTPLPVAGQRVGLHLKWKSSRWADGGHWTVLLEENEDVHQKSFATTTLLAKNGMKGWEESGRLATGAKCRE